MSVFERIRRAVHAPPERVADVARDVDEELGFHLAMREARLRDRGLSPAEAAVEARRRFGDVDQVRAECLDVDRGHFRAARLAEWIADAGRDLRIAGRTLRRSPAFSLGTAVLLGLGIGGTTAVFSVVNAIAFRPLPYPDAGRLALVQAWFADPACGRRCARRPGAAEVDGWRAHARSIETVAALDLQQGPVSLPHGSLVLEGAAVSRELPELLGLHAAIGRGLVAGDFVDGAPGALVLGHSTWVSELGGDSAVVGALATIGDRSYRIVGVLAPESELGSPIFSFNVRTAQYLVPRAATSTAVRQVVALLRPGVTPAAATAELSALLRGASGATWTVSVQPLRDALTERYRGSFGLLLGAAAVVLLLTCLNAGGLLVARLDARLPELATRAALGAGRARLARLVLAETSLLVLAGCAIGLLLAYYGTLSTRLIPADRLPFWTPVVLDLRVVLMALALAAVSCAALALAPLAALSRLSVMGRMRDLVTGAPARVRARGLIVAVEVALSVTLCGMAGLLIEQLVAAETRDIGSARRSVVFVALASRQQPVDAGWAGRTLAGLRGFPGLVSAAVAGMAQPRPAAANRRAARDSGARGPGPRSNHEVAVYAEGRAGAVPELVFPVARVVTPDWFTAIDKPIITGRAFNSSDGASTPAVAIINASAARRAFPGTSAVGHRIRIEAGGSMGEWLTIVGVSADDARPMGDAGALPAELARPWAQVAATPATIALRVRGDARDAAPLVRGALHAIDASMPIASIAPIETWIDRELWDVRFTTDLLTGFALFAGVLACLAVYATVSYVAGRRQREMAIRVAMGATRRDVVRGITRPVVRMIALGLVGGSFVAFLASRLLGSVLQGSRTMDVRMVALAGVAMLAAGYMAAWLPARRAAGADPSSALRAE